jgi:hypothetical protein
VANSKCPAVNIFIQHLRCPGNSFDGRYTLNLMKKENLNNKTYIPVVLTLCMLVLPMQYAVGVLCALVFMLYLHIKYPLFRGPLEDMLWISFFLRITIVFVNQVAPFLPDQSDTRLFSFQAMRIVENISNNVPLFYNLDYSLSVKSYSLFLSFFYRFLGEQIMLAGLINSILGLLSGILVYKISKNIFKDERSALLAAGFALFWPSIIIFTSYALRDSIVFYLTMRMIYHTICAGQKINISRNVFIAFISLLFIGIFRVQNFYLYFIILLFYALFYLFKGRGLLKLSVGIIFIMVLIILFQKNQDFINLIITYPMRAQPLRAVGETAYLQSMQYNDFFDILKYLPLRFFYFTYGPFIWNANGVFMMFAAIEGVFIFMMSILTLRYFMYDGVSHNQKLIYFLLLFCLVGLIANSIVDSNFGTVVRHRFIYITMLFLFASASLKNIRIKLL